MEKYKYFARNTVILTVGTFLSKLITFFTVRFYTDVLTPAEFGTGDLLISTVSLLMPFVSFGISEGVFRFLPEYPYAKKNIFSIGVLTVTVGSAVFTLFLPFLTKVNGMSKYASLIIFLTISACYHSVCEQYIRAEGNTVLFAKQGILNTLLAVALNIVMLTVFNFGVTGYVISVGLADLFCALYLMLKQKLWRCLIFCPNKKLFKKMLKYSIPLIPTTVFWWITGVSDRYMISAILNNEATGIYSVANKIPTMITLISGVLIQAWQYSAVSESKSSMQEQTAFYGNIWSAVLSSMFLICSGIIAFTKIETRIIANSTYFEAWRYTPVLCAAMLFCSFTSFMGSVYTVKKKSGLSLKTSLPGAGINIVLNALLIPTSLGIQGAAIATFVSYFTVFLIRAKSARKLIHFPLFKKELFIYTLTLTVQILFICFELKGCETVQAISFIIIFFVGRNHFTKKILCIFKRNA